MRRILLIIIAGLALCGCKKEDNGDPYAYLKDAVRGFEMVNESSADIEIDSAYCFYLEIFDLEEPTLKIPAGEGYFWKVDGGEVMLSFPTGCHDDDLLKVRKGDNALWDEYPGTVGQKPGDPRNIKNYKKIKVEKLESEAKARYVFIYRYTFK